ncbi:MAG: response regulator transcription factor [Acidobacteria bacterium]|nr:response regulator transcription factor [Acidobacteriota bacterium]
MPPTRVFVIADTIEGARRLAGLFTGSAGFAAAGAGTPRNLEELSHAHVDVAVIHSIEARAAWLAPNIACLWLGEPAPQIDLGVNQAWLADDRNPAQIRAAAQALAAGLRLDSRVWVNHDLGDEEFVLLEPLTDRESEILNLLAEGLSNPQIAARLKVSRNTVKFHVSSIIGKLGAKSRTEAVALALRRGLIII